MKVMGVKAGVSRPGGTVTETRRGLQPRLLCKLQHFVGHALEVSPSISNFMIFMKLCQAFHPSCRYEENV